MQFAVHVARPTQKYVCNIKMQCKRYAMEFHNVTPESRGNISLHSFAFTY